MADDYKTMIPIDSIYKYHGGYQRVYECRVCHGLLFGEGVERERDIGGADYDAAAKLSCILCDKKAPLPERYRVALGTLGQLCMQRVVPQGRNAITYSFCSFNVTVRDPDFIDTLGLDLVDLVEVRFDYEGETVLAHKDGFMVDTGDDVEDRLFDDGLDTGDDEFTPGILAHEFVYRVRHDLKLKYGEGSEPETLSVQHAGAEGGEA